MQGEEEERGEMPKMGGEAIEGRRSEIERERRRRDGEREMREAHQDKVKEKEKRRQGETACSQTDCF